jgi:hypothetical protein
MPKRQGVGPHTETLAEKLFNLRSPVERAELEEFRIKYEETFGPTDLTKRYTSLWPSKQQEWLIKHHPERYWQGLPAFVQAFLKEKMIAMHRCGKLDDAPSFCLGLYLAGRMEIDGGYSRG